VAGLFSSDTQKPYSLRALGARYRGAWEHRTVTPHALTLRLDPDLAESLALIAGVEGKPLSDILRQAAAEHVRARQADPRFRAALREHIGKARRLLGDDEAA
jgi:hypothetical protein